MSSGSCMFTAPMTRVPWSWAIIALSLGFFVLSRPLVSSTRLEPRDGMVYMTRSRAFLAILLVVLAIRLLLHEYGGRLVSPLLTASLFYLMAFGMIVRWRMLMHRQFRRLALASRR